jgi:hypothetical protein
MTRGKMDNPITNLVVLNSRDTISWNRSPFPICTDPELGMHLIVGNNFTSQDMPHNQVVVHGVRDDLGDR